MVRKLKIQCPECHDTCELFLSTTAPIVVLNCPNCWTPMLCNDDGVFRLTDDQLSQLANNQNPSLPAPIKKSIASAKKAASAAADSPGLGQEIHHPPIRPPDRNSHRAPISSDDVVNLRIDLENCQDSQAFIDSL